MQITPIYELILSYDWYLNFLAFCSWISSLRDTSRDPNTAQTSNIHQQPSTNPPSKWADLKPHTNISQPMGSHPWGTNNNQQLQLCYQRILISLALPRVPITATRFTVLIIRTGWCHDWEFIPSFQYAYNRPHNAPILANYLSTSC